MQTHITPNNKLASLGTVGLLFLAGIAGMVFLLPLNSAHAASPTITPSATSGIVGQFITLTGTGFAPGQVVGVEFGTTTITTFGPGTYPTVASLLTTTAIPGQTPPLSITCAAGTPCIETDANGWFSAIVAVPPTVGGATTITATDGVNTATSAFTVNAALKLSATSGLPDEQFAETITATGFAASDTITLASTAITASGTALGTQMPAAGSATQTVTAPTVSRSGLTYSSGPGISVYSFTGQVSEIAGGKLSVTATGAGGATDTASGTFTVNPVIALFNSQTGSATAFSMLSSGSILLAGYGFPAGTIAGNSITITATGGSSAATQHSLITVGSSGTFGAGSGNHIVVIPNTAVPQGPASIVITDGSTVSTFNYANANIAVGACVTYTAGHDCSNFAIPLAILQNGGTAVVGSLAPGYGSPFLVSSLGGSGHTALAYLDQSSYKPASTSTNSGYVTDMAVGYGTLDNTFGQPTVGITGGTALAFGSGTVANNLADANGATWFLSTTVIGDEPYSSTGYTVVNGVGTDGSVLNPTLGITQYISIGGSGTTISAQSLGTTVTFHGFTAGATCTAAVGGVNLVLTTACVINNIGGSSATGGGAATAAIAVTSTGDQTGTLDLPGGSYTITGSDGTVTATAKGFVLPTNAWGGSTNTALSVNAAPPGQITNLRSGLTTGLVPFGVHGLTALTAYKVVMDPGQPTQTTLGTFTSTAAGQIPAPGVQFAVPVGSAGMHVITLMAGTTDSLFNVVATSTGSGSTVSTTATEQSGAGNPSVSDQSNNELTSLSSTVRGQYGDGVITIGANLLAAPSAVTVGTATSILTISGSGVVAGTTYELSTLINTGGACPLTTAGTVVSGVFTATSTGSVPPSTTLPLVDAPTTAGSELGTLYCAYASTATQFPGASTGVATFDIQASAVNNMTSAPAGHSLTLSAHGLAKNTFYNVIFNPTQTITGFWSGQIVGGILANTVGAGVTNFNVPAGATPNTFSIQLQSAAEITAGTVALAAPPSLTVGGTSGTCTNQGTACMGVSGTPAVSKSGGNTIISATFTNNSNQPQTAYIYAVVHNAIGQTVLYTTATISPAAGGSQTGQLVLFGLAPGIYSATVFVVSTSGTALSTSTNVSVTV